MQENSRRTAFGRKGHNGHWSRIAFHATSFMVTETGQGLAVQISATYGTLTPIRQACQASEPNRQTTSVGPKDADSAFAFVHRRVKCAQPPQLLVLSRLAHRTTTDLGPTRYVRPGTSGAVCHSTMSWGGSKEVSIHRRQGRSSPLSADGSSNSSGSQ